MDFGSDDSPANGSSIALLAEWEDGPVALLAGDAFAGVLQTSLEHLLDGRRRLPLDVFKVPHHGSVGNLTPELLELLACRAYLVSTNGAVFGHPHERAVELLVQHHGHRARPRIVFNYHSETTAPFASQSIGGRRCTVVYPEGSGITL
jgi:beta-lactamase superfamily II metal-dependent hydrolase